MAPANWRGGNFMQASYKALTMCQTRLRWHGALLFAATILSGAALPHLADAKAPTYDLVLRNTGIIDGSGSPGWRRCWSRAIWTESASLPISLAEKPWISQRRARI